VAGVEPDPAAPKGALVTSERLAEQTIRLTADDASLTIDPAKMSVTTGVPVRFVVKHPATIVMSFILIPERALEKDGA